MLGIGSAPLKSRLPEGAARIVDIMQAYDATFEANGTGMSRGGIHAAFFDTGSNYGLGGTVSRNKNNINGITCWRERGMSGSLTYALPVIIDENTNHAASRWGFDLMVFEVALNWQANLIGKDSGLILTCVAGDRPVVGVTEGIEIYNDGGAIKFLSRGAGGAETVDLTAFWPKIGGGIPQFGLVRVELRNARKSQPASVRVLIDGVTALQRSWTGAHKLPSTYPAGGFQLIPQLGQSDAAAYLYYRDARVYMGPDTDGTLPV